MDLIQKLFIFTENGLCSSLWQPCSPTFSFFFYSERKIGITAIGIGVHPKAYGALYGADINISSYLTNAAA